MSQASAHVLESSGYTRGVLHIVPNDKPVTGKPTKIELLFQDQSTNLDLRHCDCVLTATLANKVVITKSLTASDAKLGATYVTFYEPGVYTIVASGSPQPGYTFKEFSIDYNVRVTANNNGLNNIPPVVWAGTGLAGGLGVLAAVTQINKSRRPIKR